MKYLKGRSLKTPPALPQAILSRITIKIGCWKAGRGGVGRAQWDTPHYSAVARDSSHIKMINFLRADLSNRGWGDGEDFIAWQGAPQAMAN